MNNRDREKRLRADELYTLRMQLDWTQAQFAEKLGITSNSYARCERGEHYPHDTLLKLARIIVEIKTRNINLRSA